MKESVTAWRKWAAIIRANYVLLGMNYNWISNRIKFEPCGQEESQELEKGK